MSIYKVRIIAVDQEILKQYIQLFLTISNKYPLSVRHLTKKPMYKEVTVNKSPHVDKKSRDQFNQIYFEARFYVSVVRTNATSAVLFEQFINEIAAINYFGVDLQISVQ